MDGAAGRPLLTSAPVEVDPASNSAHPTPWSLGRTRRTRSREGSRSSSTSSLAVHGVDQSGRTRTKSRSAAGSSTFEVPQGVGPTAGAAVPTDAAHRHPLDGVSPHAF
jgi:hypothetical protein